MKELRLFLAINLPERVKEELFDYQEKYSDLPVRWTPKSNLHITLVFLGDTASDKIQRIIGLIDSVPEVVSEFECKFEKIVLAPPGSAPRMFWVRVEKNPLLLKLQRQLEARLVQNSGTGYKQSSNRDYLPHITLGRIDQDKWERLQDRPRVTKSLDLGFLVDSFELMESELKPSGAEYQVLNSFSLK